MPRFRYDDDADDVVDHPPIRRRRPLRQAARSHQPDVHVDQRETDGAVLSTYPESTHGPPPLPEWVITSGNALDTDRGPIKTGKEADVHLVERHDPGTGRSALLAAKRYRAADHRLFHRDAGYLEGRRLRKSREMRAMANRTGLGRQLIAEQWASTEFATLGQLWSNGIAVPYPVQLTGTELLLEFIGSEDGDAAPRLTEINAPRAQLVELWEQCVDALVALGAEGYTHGDLSPFNVLVHDERVVLIDLPQVVDIVINPQGLEFLARDCRTSADGSLGAASPTLTRTICRHSSSVLDPTGRDHHRERAATSTTSWPSSPSKSRPLADERRHLDLLRHGTSLVFGLRRVQRGEHRSGVDREVGRHGATVADRPAMDLGDVERRARRHGLPGGTANLDDVTICFEHGVRRDAGLDRAAQQGAERRQPLVADVPATPRQAGVLRDHTSFVDELEEHGDVGDGHRCVDRLDDSDISRNGPSAA